MCDDRDTVGVMSDIVAVKLHNGCAVITLSVMPDKVHMSNNIECVRSEIQTFSDVTHIVNVISYTVDTMSYLVHVMS